MKDERKEKKMERKIFKNSFKINMETEEKIMMNEKEVSSEE